MTSDLLPVGGPAPAAVPRLGVAPDGSDRAASDEAAPALDFESLVAGLTADDQSVDTQSRKEEAEPAAALHTGQETSRVALGLVVPTSDAERICQAPDASDDEVDTDAVGIEATGAMLSAPNGDEPLPAAEVAPLPVLPPDWQLKPESWLTPDAPAADPPSPPSVHEPGFTEHVQGARRFAAASPSAVAHGGVAAENRASQTSEAADVPRAASGFPAAVPSDLPRTQEADHGVDALPVLPAGIPSASAPPDVAPGDPVPQDRGAVWPDPLKGVVDHAAPPQAGEPKPTPERTTDVPLSAVADRAGTARVPPAPHPATASQVVMPAIAVGSKREERVTRREVASDANAGDAGVREPATVGEQPGAGKRRRTVAPFEPVSTAAGMVFERANEPGVWSDPRSAAQSPEVFGATRARGSPGYAPPGSGASRTVTTLDVAPAFLLASITEALRGGAALANYALPAASEASSAPTAEYGPFLADPAQQIVKAVRLQWSEGVGEARLKLHPEHLGELSIRLRVEHGSVTASVRADSTTAAEWIRVNRAELESSLGAQGLALDTLEVIVDPDERRRQQPSPGAVDELPRPKRRRADQPRFEIHV